MSETLRLKIITPAGLAVDALTDEVVLPGLQGELGILPGHTPYLAITVSGLLVFTAGGQRRGVALRQGVAQIRDDQVTVLVEDVALAGGGEPDDLAARDHQVSRDIEEAMTMGNPVLLLQDELAFINARKALLGMKPAGK